MRLALALVFVLSATACGARAGGGVAWPKMAERESDGGETLAPHPGAAAIALSATADDDDDDITVVSSDPTEAKPAAASSASTAADEPAAESDDDDPLTVEEIVIEIEE
jgi:hypothetical protein